MKRAAVFPGQGAQFSGMGRDLAEKYPEAQDLFRRADEALSFPLSSTCFSGDAETVNRTDICQPGIFLTSAATMTVLEARRGVKREMFSAAAGLSLGEYTALWFAGAIGFEDALRLTRLRGELMQRASEAEPSGMTSVMGADLAKVEEVCASVRAGGGVVCVANLNSPGQIVISGSKAALAAAADLLKAAGARRLIALPVAGAFHSPLMASAAAGLSERLKATEVRRAAIPVVANATAEPVTEPDDIRNLLVRQLTSPVLWEKSVRRLAADGFSEFLEPAPGRVLAGLIKKIHETAVVTGYPDAASIEAAGGAA